MRNKEGIQFYGRRKGRRLSQKKQALLETLLPKLKVSLPDRGQLSSAQLFPNMQETPTKYIFEIGFGYGDMFARLHRENSNWAFLGAEPYLNGVANVLQDIEEDDHSNVSLWPDDVFQLFPALPDDTFDRIYILNPDPWHKKRHHNRRIVRQETLDIYARIMKNGGLLIMTTDVDDLAEWMVTEASNHPEFEWTAKSKTDWQAPPTLDGAAWQPTKYEQMGEEAGRKQSYLIFRRI